MGFIESSYVQKALIVGVFVALSSSQIGLFLILRKMSLIGDGLSHISLGGLALGVFLGVYPLYLVFPVVIISSLIILNFSKNSRMYFDASLGVVSVTGISIALLLNSVTGGFTIDLFSFLFGNILIISDFEVGLAIFLAIVILATVFYFYWDFFSLTFDESFAKARGIKTSFINYLFMVLVSLNVVISIRIVGVLLVSALLIIPAVTSLQIAKGFRQAQLISGLMACLTIVFGMLLSFIFNFPTSATIVLFSTFIFSLVFLFKKASLNF